MIARAGFRAEGIVQGVGFRPFVHRLAGELDLCGFVRNEADSVWIEVEGTPSSIAEFERRLQSDAPPLARFEGVEAEPLAVRHDVRFDIVRSVASTTAAPVVRIPPDTAMCADCTRELLDPTDRRHRHPFINCTNCGPRFTIIERLPYDRPSTTMRSFEMCARCATEYTDPSDRRHHAQPIACPDCGPALTYRFADELVVGTDSVLARVQADLGAGRIVAIKGVGGYHLAVDASDDEAIDRLRQRKRRPDKPFAIMVADLEAVRRIAHLGATEVRALTSPAHPIVLLRRRADAPISAGVAPHNPLVGVMLPYSPLHRLLFEAVPGSSIRPPSAIVLTSGNRSGEPICIDPDQAHDRLGSIADSFCDHDRPIHTPVDDSVVRIVGGHELPIRRSRGFAPLSVTLSRPVPAVLAVGGELKNTVGVATGRHAWLSQHLGDLETIAATDAFEAVAAALPRTHDIEPALVAVDAHPDYHSSRWGHRHAGGARVVEVQHHHAHLAALLAEHGQEDEPTIGFVFDGTGYGTDGTAWGGEILVGSAVEVERWGHLRPVRLPGGDSAAYNPCRAALAWLAEAGVDWTDEVASVAACEDTEIRTLRTQLSRSLHCIESTSMGRLFDAVASLLDVRHRISYEAQAAIELEIVATQTPVAHPLAFGITDRQLDPDPLLRDIVAARRAGVRTDRLALGFHEAVVDGMVTLARRVRAQCDVERVGLTGGVFQNALLVRLASGALREQGFDVLTHRRVPPNDGGLALGQAVVAARQLASRAPRPDVRNRQGEDERLCV